MKPIRHCYRLAEDDDDDAAAVRSIFVDALAGARGASISARMNEADVPPQRFREVRGC